MSLFKIALANLKIRKVKVLLILTGMVLGTATIVAMFSITAAMEKELRDHFDRLGTKVLLVEEQQERFSVSYRGITVAEDLGGGISLFHMEKLEVLKGISLWNNISTIAPKLVAAGSTGRGETLLVLGVDFSEEVKVKGYWSIKGRFPEAQNEILLGKNLAERLDADLNDIISLFDGKLFLVSGVLAEMGSQEDNLAYMAIEELQQLTGSDGQVSMIELVIAGDQGLELAEQLVKEIKAKKIGLAGTIVKDAVEGRKALVERFAQFSKLIAMVVILIGSLIMGTTMMSSVKERTGEIGIFRAQGFRKSHIISIILYEAATVSGLSGALGYFAGMSLAIVSAPVIGQVQTGITINPLMGFLVIGLSVTVGVLASLYPAVRAANLDPVKALSYF